jgi:hypothetical protein
MLGIAEDYIETLRGVGYRMRPASDFVRNAPALASEES